MSGPAPAPPGPATPPIPDLLDIELPDPVALWPPAPGWWLLAAAGLALMVFTLLKLRARRRRNAYRRAAGAALQAAWRDYERDGDGARYARTLNQLLKRTALVAYPRPRVAELSGQPWLAFLANTAGSITLPVAVQAFIQTAPYRRQPVPDNAADLVEVHRLGLAWIKRHRATAEYPYA